MFLPHHNLGVVIIDEAHEPSYRQESDVRYNGLLVAGGLAKAHKAKLILGSATPPVSETAWVLKNGGSIEIMDEKAKKDSFEKSVDVVDLKDRSKFSRHPLFSDKLLENVASSISSGKQSLIFINRRGTAKVMLCDDCDWQAECPDCDLPLTYHHDVHKLICHTCNKRVNVHSVCPDCGSEKVSMKSLGSKAIVEELSKLFPKAKLPVLIVTTPRIRLFRLCMKRYCQETSTLLLERSR